VCNHLEYIKGLRDRIGKVSAVTNQPNEFVENEIEVHILEMEDVLFHLNSAVMMPEAPSGKSSEDGDAPEGGQEVASGVTALALIYRQFEFDKTRRMVIAGHTDSSGGVADNFTLSEKRARGIYTLLTGRRDSWADTCTGQHKIEDYQQILKYFNRYKASENWDCDPGKADDTYGPKTEAACEKFLKKVDPDEADNIMDDIKAGDHKWPVEAWKHAYDLYVEIMAKTLGIPADKRDRMVTLQEGLRDKFLEEAHRYVGCGESFPIDKPQQENYKSQKNRRVEILLFDDRDAKRGEHHPIMTCPVGKTDAVHTAEECPLWRKKSIVPFYIDPADIHAVVYHMKFAFWNPMKNRVDYVPKGLQITAWEEYDGVAERREIPTVTVAKGTTYYVKVQYSTTPDDPKRKAIHFEFKTERSWVFTGSKTALPEFFKRNVADVRKERLIVRLRYYDLPAHWSSRNYWTRYDGVMKKGDRFEKVIKDHAKLKPFGGKITDSSKPLIFSLDDIVLLKPDGSQDVKDKDESDAAKDLSEHSRLSILYVKSENLTLYNPESADQPYFTKFKFKADPILTRAGKRINVIHDTPTDGHARLVVFANDFYHIWDKRTCQTDADPYDATRDIKGARAAVIGDTARHVSEGLNNHATAAGHQRYSAKHCGNYELHYLHDGCLLEKGPDKLMRRSFLIIYWNCYFKTFANPDPKEATAAQIATLATKGLTAAVKRWASKGYTIEPRKPSGSKEKSDIQIQPFYFFEAKQEVGGDRLGGKPKCEAWVHKTDFRSDMSTIEANFNYKDYKETGDSIADIDGKSYKELVISHEIGHAMGKDDEYGSWIGYMDGADITGGVGAFFYNTDDERFSQYYIGMPFDADNLSNMCWHTGAPRMKHLWFNVNWLNDKSKTGGSLNTLLAGHQFEVVHRFTREPKQLNYWLPSGPPDAREVIVPIINRQTLNTGIGQVDIGVYKMGDDEYSRSIKISGKRQKFAFDAVMVVYIKVGFDFDGAGWETDGKSNWMTSLRQQLQHLNGRFYLSSSSDHELKNIYVCFAPACFEDAPLDKSHYRLKVYWDNESTFTVNDPLDKELEVSFNSYMPDITNYIFGHYSTNKVKAFFKKLIGQYAPGKNRLKFIETWWKARAGCGDFTLKGK